VSPLRAPHETPALMARSPDEFVFQRSPRFFPPRGFATPPVHTQPFFRPARIIRSKTFSFHRVFLSPCEQIFFCFSQFLTWRFSPQTVCTGSNPPSSNFAVFRLVLALRFSSRVSSLVTLVAKPTVLPPPLKPVFTGASFSPLPFRRNPVSSWGAPLFEFFFFWLLVSGAGCWRVIGHFYFSFPSLLFGRVFLFF